MKSRIRKRIRSRMRSKSKTPERASSGPTLTPHPAPNPLPNLSLTLTLSLLPCCGIEHADSDRLIKHVLLEGAVAHSLSDVLVRPALPLAVVAVVDQLVDRRQAAVILAGSEPAGQAGN